MFPFYDLSHGKTKCIYITCVIVAILLPLVPIIITILAFVEDSQKQSVNSLSKPMFPSEGLGYSSSRFPPFICFAKNGYVFVYFQIVLCGSIIALGLTLLLVIFWVLHKLKKRKDSKVCKNLVILFLYFI